MKTKLFFITLLALACYSCEPNTEVTAPKSLLGEWYCVNNSTLTVTISDSLIYSSISDRFVCQYTHDSAKLYLKRLWCDESEPYYNADCNYYWVGDTLHIENFIETYAANNPPVFTNVILVRSTSEKPDTEPCNHQCFANDTLSDEELTKMLWKGWAMDDEVLEFGWGNDNYSFVYYWNGEADIWEGYGILYRFRVEDGKILFYTDKEFNEANIIYGLNISFHSCFYIEDNKLHIHQFTLDGSNFFPLTLQ